MKRPKTWRGRRVYYNDRYPRVFWKGHPMASAQGHVRIHRVVAMEMLGRPLRADEHVHHKNEDTCDWRRSNLEVLSSSEHSAHHRTEDKISVPCAECGKELLRTRAYIERYKNMFCSLTCSKTHTERAVWPSKDELEKLVWEQPATRIAASLGVSSVAVKKRCKRLGIEPPPPPRRGYWAKSSRV